MKANYMLPSDMAHCTVWRHIVLTLYVLVVLFVLQPQTLYAAGNAEIASAGSATKADNQPKGNYLGAMETEYPDWFKTSFLDLYDDVEEAAADGKRVMLVFHQDGCPYCNAFVERNLAQKDIVESIREKFDAIEINMWGDREVGSVQGTQYTEKSFAAALKIQFTPTVLFLNEAGQIALRINGYYDPDRFRLALRYVAEKQEETLSFKEFLIKHQGGKSPGNLTAYAYLTGSIEELVNRPGKGSRPLLVMFEQKDCTNCQTLQQRVFSREETQELLTHFDVFQVNLWGNRPFKTPSGRLTTGREWGKELSVSYAPTLILYASTGEEVIRSEAWFKSFHTQSILDYVRSNAWLEQPSFQRYISARADNLREQGVDVNIWD